MDNNIYDTLQNYIDGALAEAESQEVTAKLEKDGAWQQAYEELKALQMLLEDDSQLLQPSMRFTQDVMEKVAVTPIAKSSASLLPKHIFWVSIVVLGGGLLTALLVLISKSNFNWGSDTSASNIPTFSMPDFSFSFIQNDQVIMGMGMLLILMFLAMAEVFLSSQKKMQ